MGQNPSKVFDQVKSDSFHTNVSLNYQIVPNRVGEPSSHETAPSCGQQACQPAEDLT